MKKQNSKHSKECTGLGTIEGKKLESHISCPISGK